MIPKYNAVSYSEIEKIYAAVENNFNMPDVGKLNTCVCFGLEIINFTNSHTCSFSYPYLKICRSGF